MSIEFPLRQTQSVALAAPGRPVSPMLDLEMLWERVLQEEVGLRVERLSRHEPGMRVIEEWTQTLRRVGALVIVSSSTDGVKGTWDANVLAKIEAADRAGCPVLSQADPSSVNWSLTFGSKELRERVLGSVPITVFGIDLEMIKLNLRGVTV